MALFAVFGCGGGAHPIDTSSAEFSWGVSQGLWGDELTVNLRERNRTQVHSRKQTAVLIHHFSADRGRLCDDCC